MELQGVTGGLQGVPENYRGFQEATGDTNGYKWLQKVTGGTRGYSRL